MHRAKVFCFILKTALIAASVCTACLVADEAPRNGGGEQATLQAPQRRSNRATNSRVYKTQIAPNWIEGSDRFWYRNDLRDGKREFILVDAVQGERQRAFDHERLAQALRDQGVEDILADQLPMQEIAFDAENRLTFTAMDKHWRWDLASEELQEIDSQASSEAAQASRVVLREIPRGGGANGPESELAFVNQTEGDVELFWLEGDGGRRSYGVLAAGEERSQHTFAGHVWLAVDGAGTTIAAFRAQELPQRAAITGRDIPERPRRWNRGPRGVSNGGMSPDGKWRARVRDHNVFIVAADDGADDSNQEDDGAFQLTDDGTADREYRMLEWSPNSRSLVAFRVEDGDRKEVYRIESSPEGGGRAVLHTGVYPLPGDKFTSYEPFVFCLEEGSSGDVEWAKRKPDVEPIDFGRPRLHWNDEGTRFTYEKVDRGHQRFRLIEIDACQGDARVVLDEQTDTFIWTMHAENVDVRPVTWLEDTEELIYASEVNGHRHLYLLDPSAVSTEQGPGNQDGEAQLVIENGEKRLYARGWKNAITQGDFVVRGVDRIDETKRQVWFHASGRNASQDPYFVHYYRVNFDGTNLVALTEGDGQHAVELSPDGRFLIDTYSRVDAAPINELREAESGRLVCRLEEADVSELEESGWRSPDVFVAKGRDGETDIWGIISWPTDYDPNKKYPVIEDLYAGPHSAYVPKRFSSRSRYRDLNDLGFIVVKIDGMGTAHRSKAFHDVCWQQLKDAGFADRILWIQAAAKKYGSLDLDRVGVYGVSAGGQNAAAAVLFHHDFYKAAVAGCGCHDNRMDKYSWNEQWMGYPVGPQYSESSNIDNAHRLQGKLFLIVGEMDNNVPPESTLRFVDALIKADKDFDMLLVPGAGHGIGGNYGRRRMHDFFVEHLAPGS